MTFSERITGQAALPGAGFEQRVTTTGRELAESFRLVLEGVQGAPHSPQKLATTLALDKVFTSRLLKALKSRDPIAVVHRMPGPEPLRRMLRSARRRGAQDAHVRAGGTAVDHFEMLIREEAGDRGSLDAILSAWLPDAREEFELRRKQAVFKAMSQLRGAACEMDFSAVILHPSPDGVHLDVVWIIGMFGLQRLRPDVVVKFATRRISEESTDRRPTSLEGSEVEGLDRSALAGFCDAPPAPLEAERVKDTVHYMLGDSGFGPKSAVDVVFAEVNRNEIGRFVPAGSGRKGWVFAEISTPARRMQFDVFVHREAYPDAEPELLIYDTSIEGIADVNDRRRDVNRMNTTESITPLGYGSGQLRTAEVPSYVDLLAYVYSKLGWEPDDYRGYRCRVDYPIYGSQISMAFGAPETPEAR